MFSRQQALRLSRVLFLLVATITVWACQNPDPKIDKQPKGPEQQAATAHKETPPGATAPTPGTAKTPVSTDKTSALTPPPAGDRLTLAFKPSATAFENAAALKHLAPDTPIVIVATDPQSLLNRLGREALTKKFANYYEKGVAEVAQTIGHNILDPKNLPEVGIDPTAPVGFALVKISRPVGVFFFGLSDADKFKTSLYSVAGRVNEKMEPHVVGDSMVICPRNDEEVCFILKGNIAFVHFADMSDEKALESAMAFAARTADLPSLGTDEGFMATIKALKYGKDAAVYVSMSGLLKGVLGVENGWAKDSLDNAKNQLEKYKKEENQTEVKYWEGRVKDAEEWYEKDIKRQAKQQEMLKALMGGLEGMVMGASLEDRSIKLKSYTELPPDSPWSKIALGVEGISPLVTFLPKTPLYMAHAKVNIEEYLKMLEPIIGAEGISMEQMREMFKVATELDLDQDVLATLSGEIGFAISGDLSRFDDSEKAGFMALDGYTFLGLADSGKMAALMTSLSANPILSDFLRPAGDGKWQVIVPEWKTVDIALLDKYLVASTDPTFIESMRTGKGTSFLDSISNE